MSTALAHGILREASQTAVLIGHRRGAQLFRDPQRPMHAEFVVSEFGELVTVFNPVEQSADHDREAVYAPVRRQRRAARSPSCSPATSAAPPPSQATTRCSA